METLTYTYYSQWQDDQLDLDLNQLISKSTLLSKSSKVLLFMIMIMLGLITNAQIINASETENNNNNLNVSQTNFTLLKVGSQGEEVVQLQTKLKILKFFDSEITGYFGNITRNAVMAFQRANNLTPTGSADATTQARIVERIQALNDKSENNNNTNNNNNSSSVLKQNSQGETVKTLQENLKKLNFFKEESTGFFGNQTKEAVIAFQKANNLTADGIVGNSTQVAIQQSLTKENHSNQTSNPTNNNTNNILKKGMQGQEVLMLQEKLKKIGVYDGPITGTFGNLTEEAVKKLQTKNKITADGIISTQTQAIINSQLQNVVNTNSSNSSNSTNNNSANTNVIKFGDQGEQVRLLQEKLTQAKVYNGPITGTFGNLTLEAVKKFQSQNGLTADGVMGAKTQALLSSKTTNNNQAVTVNQSAFSSQQIAIFQQQLQALNYYQGKIDGTLGPGTIAALSKFQIEEGLEITGIFDQATQTALNKNYIPVSNNNEQRVVTPYHLSENPSVQEIQMIQRRLQVAGLYQGPINGVMNAQTKKALEQARLAYGITTDETSK